MIASAYSYRLRKQLVEPVFGQIKQARGFRQFLLRSLDNVKPSGLCFAPSITSSNSPPRHDKRECRSHCCGEPTLPFSALSESS